MNIKITVSEKKDFPEIWTFLKQIIKKGDTLSCHPDISYEEAKDFWFEPDYITYKATLNGKIVGAYHFKANFSGLGSHVANGSYIVDPKYQGQQIGKQLVIHSMKEAKKAGFKAMQYNLVISTNKPAIFLYEKLEFKIIGTIPKGFNHLNLGYVDAYIMHRFL